MRVPLRRVMRTEWLAVANTLYRTPQDVVFRCVRCDHQQSINSAQAAGVDVSEADTWIYFACEGRHRTGVGCDWSLGGLFQIHNLEVVDDRSDQDGKPTPSFDFAHASVLGERVRCAQDAEHSLGTDPNLDD